MSSRAMTAAVEPMPPALRDHVLRLGMWMFIATVTMLFAAFSSAYIVRGAGTDWQPVTLPAILWLNTVVILVSSVALEIGRREARGSRFARARAWLQLALLLGATFLVGQYAAWRALVAAGVYVPTTPHASFFYLLTGLHGAHIIAGLVLLGLATLRLTRAAAGGGTAVERTALRVADLGGIFWHFLAGLWLYLLLLLTFFS